MAITLRCSCGSESKLTAKVCSKCGTAFPKKGRKDKVTLRMDGKKVTRTVTSVELARGIEAKLKVDIAPGDHQLVKRAAAPTLAEVWKRYWPWAEANKKSAEDDRWNYERHLRPRFGDKRLDQISPFAIDVWSSDKAGGWAPDTRAKASRTTGRQVASAGAFASMSRQMSAALALWPSCSIAMPVK